jgi:hypothetical protein
MMSLAILGLSSMAVVPVAVGHDGDGRVFAPQPCTYSVTFPLAPSLSRSTATDGGQDSAADLIRGSNRLSAACLGPPPGSPARPLPAADAKAQMLQMTRALGVQNATLQALPAPRSECAEINGALGDGHGSYRISARICLQAGATFIAEVVYRADIGLDTTGKAFLASLGNR